MIADVIIKRRYLAAATAVLLMGALAYVQVRRERQAPRTFFAYVSDPRFRTLPTGSLAISGDGRLIAYVSGNPTTRLVVWRYATFGATVVNGSDGATSPFFSPDGRWLGFAAGNALQKIPVDGGPVTTLCPLDGELQGASWGSNGEIYFSTADKNRSGPIQHVPAAGGAAHDVAPIEADEIGQRWPEALPGGRSLLYTATNASTARQVIYIRDLVSGERRRVAEGDTARYVTSGHLVFLGSDSLMAAPFDAASGRLTGEPVAIGPQPERAARASQFAVSASGMIAIAPIGIDAAVDAPEMVWVSRTGIRRPVGPPPAEYRTVALSPDQSRVAYQIAAPTCPTSVYDLARHTVKVLPFEAPCSVEIWTPDSARLTYRCIEPGRTLASICWAPADASGPPEVLVRSPNQSLSPKSWTGDGRTLTVVDDQIGFYVWSRDDARGLRPILGSLRRIGVPRLNWDGTLMAFGQPGLFGAELHIASYPDLSGAVLVDNLEASSPRWRRDGRELFYKRGATADAQFIVASIETKPALRVSSVAALFRGNYAGSYDVSVDGVRLLAIYTPPPAEAPHLVIMQNWLAGLLRR